jgi:hypothetical protein
MDAAGWIELSIAVEVLVFLVFSIPCGDRSAAHLRSRV